MKTTLLAFLCMALFPFSNLFAQPCDLTNIQFEKVYTGTDGKCYADLFFDMRANNGNKYIYVHFWTALNFSKIDKAAFTSGFAPGFAEINGTTANPHPALATLAIDNDNTSAPVWNASNYLPDPSVITVKAASLRVSSTPVSGSGPNALYRYTIKAVPLGNLGGACSAASLGVAVWSSQANSTKAKIHCSVLNSAVPESLALRGLVLCSQAKYTLTLTNKTGKAMSGKIDVLTDRGAQANDGSFDIAHCRKFDAITYFLVEPDQTLSIMRTIPDSCIGYNVFAQAVYSDEFSQLAQLSTTSCATLPVVLQSFSASRAKQQVAVNWQTASEQAVRGFNILRKGDGPDWKTIGFVPSKAAGGFSSENLFYEFADLFPLKGVSQYRLEELGSDGKTTLSEIRTVKGEEQATKITIYPNPAINGKAIIAFDKPSIRDVIISDMSGRIFKQLNGLTSSNATVDHLKDGFYIVQVIDRTTNESTVLRLVVKK